MKLRKRDRAKRPFQKIKARLKDREDEKAQEAFIFLIACILTIIFYVVAGYI